MVQIDKDRLIAQLKEDERFSAKAFWDNKQWTVGYGCLGREGQVITPTEADILLRVRVEQSIREFELMFPGELSKKFNEVRAEAFINMLFNLGLGRKDGKGGGLRSFKNTLSLVYDHLDTNWSAVAAGMASSLWARQVGKRAERICKEIATGEKV